MERLSKELDGFYRTASGFCAVVPKRATGVTPEGMKWFEYRVGPYSGAVRVEWPKQAPLALFDNETASAMIRSGYGFNPTDAQIEEYNKLVDEALSAAPPVPPVTPPVANGFPPDGWLPHPTAAGFFYQGQVVLSEADLRAKAAASI